MLRQDVYSIVSLVDDPNEAAKLLCCYLNDVLGLSGNGWFDDDPVLEPVFFGDGVQERDRLETAVKQMLS